MVFCILYFVLGFSTAKLFIKPEIITVKESKVLDGCYSKSQTGDWVCVNIEDMTYQRAYDVCKHEVGHEIFAEEMEACESENVYECIKNITADKKR